LPPCHRFLYFVLLPVFSTKTAWQRKSKHYERFYEGNLCQTMVDSWYCLFQVGAEGMSQVSRQSEVGKQTALCFWMDSAVKWVFYALFVTTSIVKNFIPLNIRKSLDTIPCEGVLCIVVQFSRVEYNFWLYRFLLSETSPSHFDCLTLPVKRY